MKKVGLIDVDGHNGYPNLALMKIARYHRGLGDNVEWYEPFCERYDVVYMSKVFNFTPDYPYFINNADKVVRGGTGYDNYTNEHYSVSALPDEIDRLQPDYLIYPQIDKKTAYGFLTRGCIRKCKFCVVPKKEGLVRPYMDVDEIAIEGRNKLILMDNNVLASEWGLQQIEKIADKGYRVDFNQGLDARLVSPPIAKLLARVRYIRGIRFACDNKPEIEACERAMDMILSYNPAAHFHLYCILLADIKDAYERASYWRKNKRVRIYCQAYKPVDGEKIVTPQWQRDMQRWADRKELYTSTDFMDYVPRVGETGRQYFDADYAERMCPKKKAAVVNERSLFDMV